MGGVLFFLVFVLCEAQELNSLTLQLTVVVDEALYNEFKKRDQENVQKNIEEFVSVIVNTVHILYKLDSIQPKINVQLERLIIWEKQPDQLLNIPGGPMGDYLDSAQLYFASAGNDHTVVLSGLGLTQHDGSRIAGLAFMSTTCTRFSISVVNALPEDLWQGYILAHEMGHNLGICHDGEGFCSDTARFCQDGLYLMSTTGTGVQVKWSPCSAAQLAMFVHELVVEGNNCLGDTGVTQELPFGSYPGQLMPIEAQVLAWAGQCAISDASRQRDNCRQMFITVPTQRGLGYQIEKILLEGTFCAPGKVCLSGECVETSENLQVVNGGWSKFNSLRINTAIMCYRDKCQEACQFRGQILIDYEYRRCDQPAPNNGGSFCPGINFRLKKCAKSCNFSPSANQIWLRDCARIIGDRVQVADHDACRFECSRSFVQITLNKPDGSPCVQGGKSGVCKDGDCFEQCSNDAELYTQREIDCFF